MSLLKALQLVDDDGRLNVALILLIVWLAIILRMNDPDWVHSVISFLLIGSLHLERFMKARDVKRLHDADLERIAKLEADLGEIRGALSLATQRTMF
jgi:hypothetical protein